MPFKRRYRSSPTTSGMTTKMLLGANAAGAVVGGLLLEGRGLLKPSARNAAICSILWCMAITGFAATTSYPLAIALLFCAGLLNLAFLSMAQTLVQLGAPAQLRGRLIGLFNMSHNGLGKLQRRDGRRDRRTDQIRDCRAISSMILLAVDHGLICAGYAGHEKREIPLSGPANGQFPLGYLLTSRPASPGLGEIVRRPVVFFFERLIAGEQLSFL